MGSQSELRAPGRWPPLVTKLPSKSFAEVSARWQDLDHLVIVPGHAIQWCTEYGQRITDRNCWFLYDFQKGQLPLLLEHIKVAAQLAHDDPRSLLVFSGGQTRPGLGPRSEGQSYFAVADVLGLFKGDLFDRTLTEDFARDSLENVIFSMARFREITGSLPTKVTIVGFPFKERRFTELHRQAAKIPAESFTYVSVRLKGYGQDHIVDDAYVDFQKDLYGCGSKLSGKRALRNPYKQHHGYKEFCPELKSILSICDMFHP